MKHLKNKDMPDWAVGEEVSAMLKDPIVDCKGKGYKYLVDWFRTNMDIEISQTFLVTRAKYYDLHDFYSSKEEVKAAEEAEEFKKQVNQALEDKFEEYKIWIKGQLIYRANARLKAYHWRVAKIERSLNINSPEVEDVLIPDDFD